ncbi:substrate-binding domain-containing protein [Candidatus Sumerlaeota bacterium]|nr:substrate-binding domain-containing protein [Candidatus Sumerlaeota bacterium]
MRRNPNDMRSPTARDVLAGRRNRIRPAAIGLAVLGLAMLWMACSGSGDGGGREQLVVPGTGSCESVLKQLAEAFNQKDSGIEAIIPASTGTSGGIQSVVSGESPLGRVGRPLKEEEKAKGLTFVAFAQDLVVFAVGESVEVESLTTSQLGAIFKGEITNWRDLGATDAPIRVVGRQPGEASREEIAKHLETFRDETYAQGAKIAFHDGEMADLLNKYPTSIGFLPNSLVRAPGNKMRVVALDGVAPTVENAISGKYPLMTTAGFVYKNGGLSGAARAFVDFVFSDAGRRIMSEAGMAPVARR